MPVSALAAWTLAAVLGGAPAQGKFEWPMPDALESIELPGVSQADGVPVRLHVLRTRRSAQEMLQVYADAFDRAGFYIDPRQKRRLAQPHLTALDVRTLISRTVVLQPHPDGSTTCVLGEANLGAAQRAAQAQAGPPAMPGAVKQMRVNQEGSRFLSFQVKGKADGVHSHYRASLGAAGWTPSPRAEEEGVFTRGEQVLRVMVKESEPGQSDVLLIEHG